MVAQVMVEPQSLDLQKGVDSVVVEAVGWVDPAVTVFVAKNK